MSTYLIDDQDTTVFRNGTWVRGGSPDVEYKGTVSSSTNVGDYLIVPFRGTNIAVFVTFDTTSGGVEVTLSIDNNSTEKAVSQAGLDNIHQQQLWKSDLLAMSDHTLLINMTKVNPQSQVGAGEGTIWFDYFMVMDPTRPPSSATPTSTSTSTQSPGKSSSERTGAIVGGVIGGLFFLLVFVFLLFFRRKTKARTAEDGLAGSRFFPETSGSAIQPFLLTTTNVQVDGRKPTANSGTEFNPWTMVSPPVFHKSGMITPPRSDSSNQPSSSDRSPAPLISYDARVPSPASSADNYSTHYRNAMTDRDQHSRLLQVDGVATSENNSPAPANENLDQAPLQHIDSGMRATAVGRADVLAARVELPPVYSQS